MEIHIYEAAIDNHIIRRRCLLARLAHQRGNPHGLEISSRNITAVGENPPAGIELSINLVFDLVERGDARKHARRGGVLDAGKTAQTVESSINALHDGFHVTRFSPGTRDLERQHAAGIKAWSDSADFLQAAQK